MVKTTLLRKAKPPGKSKLDEQISKYLSTPPTPSFSAPSSNFSMLSSGKVKRAKRGRYG